MAAVPKGVHTINARTVANAVVAKLGLERPDGDLQVFGVLAGGQHVTTPDILPLNEEEIVQTEATRFRISFMLNANLFIDVGDVHAVLLHYVDAVVHDILEVLKDTHAYVLKVEQERDSKGCDLFCLEVGYRRAVYKW